MLICSACGGTDTDQNFDLGICQGTGYHDAGLICVECGAVNDFQEIPDTNLGLDEVEI